VAGGLDDFKGDNALAIGIGFAQTYRVQIGDLVTLISPQGEGDQGKDPFQAAVFFNASVW
jgi:ABC-type lipoprotein release transport system permease subunit